MRITRRQLLALIGGGAVAGSGGWAALVRDRDHDHRPDTRDGASASAATRKTLVVVQLAGGNDGLNTVVPTDGRYRDARPTLAIADEALLRPSAFGAFGLHPSLEPLVPLVDAGHVAAVHNVGLHHRSRSHFECSQHWWDGSDGHGMSDTGWIGRWLDATKPAGAASPLRAVAIGPASGASALRADESMSTVVIDPSAFRVADPAFEAAYRATDDERIGAALDAVDALGPALGDAPEGNGTITDGLQVAAELITADVGIEIILVGASGFDTHANQAETQTRLLADLAGGVAAFQHAMTNAHLSERVLLLTTSEFGRRVAENGSAGTDHGAGNCLFAVGPAVRGGVVGDVDLVHLDEGDLLPTVDPRSFLATGLRFLGGDIDEVFDSWEDLGLLRA